MFKNPLLHVLATFYHWIVAGGSNLQSLFLLWVRFTWGHQFFLIGQAKLANIDQTIQAFTLMHLPVPTFHAFFIGYLELIGGILLMIGFCSRLIAIPLSLAMLVALSTAHAHELSDFQFIFTPSILVHQPPYPFLIACLLILIFGPGRISLDAWIKRWASKQPKY